MDEIRHLFQTAFSDGCGVSLEQAMGSETYRHHAALYSRQPEPLSREFLAQRVGHHHFGRAILDGTLVALVDAEERKWTPMPSPDGVQFRALCSTLGEFLIGAAKPSLPEAIRALARAWKEADADGQAAMSHELALAFARFRASAAAEIDNDSIEAFLNAPRSNIEAFFDVDPGRFLPFQWQLDNALQLNCLGLSIMLGAFADEAGSPSHLAIPVIAANYMTERYLHHETALTLLSCGLKKLLTFDNCFSFVQALNARFSSMELAWSAYHGALVLPMKDERWLCLDPYAAVFGPLPTHLHLAYASDILTTYHSVLPGLSVQLDDGGIAERELKARFERLRPRIDAAAREALDLRHLLLAEVEAGRDPIARFVQTPVYEDIIRREGVSSALRENVGDLRLAAMYFYCDPELTSNPGYVPENFDAGLASTATYHVIHKINALRRELHQDRIHGHWYHPAMEIADLRYSLGLRVVHDLALYAKEDALFYPYLQEHSYGQLTLLERLLFDSSNEALLEALKLRTRHLSIESIFRSRGLVRLNPIQELLQYLDEEFPDEHVA